ncbi:MAG: hypothetical protein IT309_04175 [Anaerolineales bacterium]|jgi:hypothetical protein|nr:hypothetical protein [Anaerolineales bacterium]
MNSPTPQTRKKIHPLAWQGICLFISLAAYVFILDNRSPNLLRPLSMALRTGFGAAILLATLILYGAFRIRGQVGALPALAGSMSLFALGLAGLWASGDTQSIILNGLIPLTDAAGYYTDALRLQYGGDVSNFTAMRPFFAGLLSFLLWLSGRNLMIAVGIFTAIAGYSSYLAAREVHKTHGAEAAVFFLILMFLYYRHHSGTAMSESLGVPVSLLGVALLWRGIAARNEWPALFGVAVIALALNIRPGAMFVLPALLLWGGWAFRGQGRFSFKFLGLGTALILAVFFINNRMIAFVNPGGVAFENFAWAFYGLASGGNSWTYVFEANPQLALLKDTEVTPAIYKLAFDLILTQPSLIVKGALFYWGMFFSDSWYNAYAFVGGDNYWISLAARWAIYALNALGIYKWFRNRNDLYASLALTAALGVLASVPFVPPTDAYRVRLYAATIPFFALLPAMGLAFLAEKLPATIFSRPSEPSEASRAPAILSVILIAAMIAPPILIKSSGTFPPAPKTACANESEGFYTRYDEGTAINLNRENKSFIDWMPNFHISLFRRNIHSLPDSFLISAMSGIDPENTLFYGLDLATNETAIVILPTDQLPKPGSLILLCGEWVKNPGTPYVFFVAEQVMTADAP